MKKFPLGVPIVFLSMDLSFFLFCNAFKQCFLFITRTITFSFFFPRRWQASISFVVILTSIAFNMSTTFSSSWLSLTDWRIPEISTLLLRLYWSTLLFKIAKSIILFYKTFTLVLRRLFWSWRFLIIITFRLITSSFRLVIFCVRLDLNSERADRRSGWSVLIASLLLVLYDLI